MLSLKNRIYKIIISAITLIFVFIIFKPAAAYARHGDSGYEGGISSGEVAGKTVLDYKEMCFITGHPTLFEGTLVIRKSSRNDTISTTYTYNLKNDNLRATLNRTCFYSTKSVKKGNGQTQEITTLSRMPSEVIRINGTTYSLRDNEFTYSSIVEHKPSIDYRVGDIFMKKVYQIGTGTNSGNITVEVLGNSYGYSQYWGDTEAMVLDYTINSKVSDGEIDDEWTGTAKVSLSTTSIKENRFVENKPDEISFDGGYVETQYNSSILEYNSKLPEFDSRGISTYHIVDSKGSLEIETFPTSIRLPIPKTDHLRGHWAEEDIRELLSLEVFENTYNTFNPEDYITRGEFISAVVRGGREVPTDPSLVSKTRRKLAPTRKNKTEEITSPFIDVPIDSPFFEDINNAHERGIISYIVGDEFHPEDGVTLGDALIVFIRCLGLESLAPNPNAVTVFKDNDDIPQNAREAVFVAHRIGLIQGDEKGYLRPNEKMTKARSATLLNRFINYMRYDIRKDYRERMVNFN